MSTAIQAQYVWAAANAGKATVATAGGGAARFVARNLLTGAIEYIGARGMDWLFSQFGWEWDPDGPDPYPATPGGSCGGTWTVEGVNCTGFTRICRIDANGGVSCKYGLPAPGHKLTSWTIREEENLQGYHDLDVYYVDIYGQSQYVDFGTYNPPPGGVAVCLYVDTYSDCDAFPGPEGPVTPAPVYQESGDCTYKVQMDSVIYDEYQQPTGILYKVGPDDREEFAAQSGPITECNIAPTWVFNDAKGGDDVFLDPIGPDGEEVSVDEIVRRLRNPIISEVNNNTNEKLQQYFDERIPMLPGEVWNLQGVCERDEDGNILDPQPLVQWEFAAGSAVMQSHEFLLEMDKLLQQQLDWRHLTCGESTKPELQGDWVSTGWVSIEASENSNRPLRKLFRYRSLGDRDVIALLGYWKDFQWEAGPVCVIHKGAWWGLPQVWAASEEEGKRVIRFAGVNAGIDPDTEGTWQISTSTGSRYGRTGTMTLACHKGQYHVSARDDADWPTRQPGEIYES